MLNVEDGKNKQTQVSNLKMDFFPRENYLPPRECKIAKNACRYIIYF